MARAPIRARAGTSSDAHDVRVRPRTRGRGPAVPPRPVIDAPTSAPSIVNISRNMPTLRFVRWSRTYAGRGPARRRDHRDHADRDRMLHVEADVREHRHEHDAAAHAAHGPDESGDDRDEEEGRRPTRSDPTNAPSLGGGQARVVTDRSRSRPSRPAARARPPERRGATGVGRTPGSHHGPRTTSTPVSRSSLGSMRPTEAIALEHRQHVVAVHGACAGTNASKR